VAFDTQRQEEASYRAPHDNYCDERAFIGDVIRVGSVLALADREITGVVASQFLLAAWATWLHSYHLE
jgi:hypothetical protein